MTELSVPAIAALAAAAVLVIGAVAGGIVTVITAWRTIAQKVVAIESHVNSEKTASEGREATLKRENELLREMLAEKKSTAALLAQAAVRPGPIARSTDPVPVEVVNQPVVVTTSDAQR